MSAMPKRPVRYSRSASLLIDDGHKARKPALGIGDHSLFGGLATSPFDEALNDQSRNIGVQMTRAEKHPAHRICLRCCVLGPQLTSVGLRQVKQDRARLP